MRFFSHLNFNEFVKSLYETTFILNQEEH